MFNPGNSCFGRKREESLTSSGYKDKLIGNTFVRCAIYKGFFLTVFLEARF